MGKGTLISVQLPLKPDKTLHYIAQFVRLTEGGIRVSRQYVKSNNQDPEELVKVITNYFQLAPKYTANNEPLFCSGVLKALFSKFLVREQQTYIVPKVYEEILC